VAAADRAAVARAEGWARPWEAVAQDVKEAYTDARERFGRRTAIFALPWFDVGGAEHFVLTLVRGMEGDDLVPCVAASPGRLTKELDASAEFAPLRRLRAPSDAVLNLAALAGLTVRTNPSAVNSHHLPTGLLARATALGSRRRARHALTIHVTEDPRMAPVAGIAGAFAFDAVLPVAESVRREITRFVPRARRRRFTVVHGGVDPLPETKKVAAVGVVARLVERKGHRVLLDAWRGVLDDPQLGDWGLELWGDGPEEDALRAQAEDLGIGSTVVFQGAVRDAATQVGRFPIVALPSFREGLPLVLLEAMAAGCAVVCSDLPGCRELLGDDVGLRVPPGDPEALRDALLALMTDEALRATQAQVGRDRVTHAFSRTDMVEEYRRALWLG
jgi:glycosyltransferase involved in cell wall biosynthesis